MSSHLIPMPENLGYWRQQLFNLTESITLTQQQFDTYWPWVDNIYSLRSSESSTKRAPHIFTQFGECRLLKSRESGSYTPVADISKRRKVSHRTAGQCHVKIRIVREVKEGMSVYTLSRYAPAPGKGVSVVPGTSIPDHSHDLDASDLCKKNSRLHKIITNQLLNHVKPSQIHKNLFGNGLPEGSTRIHEAGGFYLTAGDIENIAKSSELRKTLQISDQRIFRSTWDHDLMECIEFLSNNGYICEQINAEVSIPVKKRLAGGPKTRNCFGLVFAKETRLQDLARHGYLTLMDSTHDTNVHGFNLFTFMIRDSYGTWIPGAHVLLESESGELIAKSISVIRGWTGDQWQPRYFLTDDSAAEQLGVKLAFQNSGLQVDHLLCVFHSMQTLIRRLSSHPESLECLRKAIFARTSSECIQLIEQSILQLREWNTPNKESRATMARYIRNNWLARHHQCVEAWHKRLKSFYKSAKSKLTGHGLKGCCMNVEQAGKRVEAVSFRAKQDFHNKQVREVKVYPELALFPHPIQKKLVVEIRKMQARVERGLWISHAFHAEEAITCNFSVPGLPQHASAYVLTDLRWRSFAELFHSRGFEAYSESATSVPLGDERQTIEETAATRLRQHQLPVRQMLEQLRAAMFSFGERLIRGDTENRQRDENTYVQWCQQVVDANQQFIHFISDNSSSSGIPCPTPASVLPIPTQVASTLAPAPSIPLSPALSHPVLPSLVSSQPASIHQPSTQIAPRTMWAASIHLTSSLPTAAIPTPALPASPLLTSQALGSSASHHTGTNLVSLRRTNMPFGEVVDREIEPEDDSELRTVDDVEASSTGWTDLESSVRWLEMSEREERSLQTGIDEESDWELEDLEDISLFAI
ncbi:hypothetical protein BJ508DRAFT_304679 [Ascobolus immersus RN42]|uniref:MULE transposase domain-containing protein n=1 Tax=Ascobolus immersus RN42 TaxID=1160509 RepID=A0A3N4IBN0_ASCIM|nr:hypothetical protein BJ508DRAFT_304658 [Ascobolus immersus RN42]RPA83492.1 hypothetical protein BJ508DRAFT_304679 [Ascobolus immersus RN42]